MNLFILCILVIFVTAAGNVLVCLAIARERKLQNTTNYFLMSLAVADCLVAVLVMPMGMISEIIGTCLNRFSEQKKTMDKLAHVIIILFRTFSIATLCMYYICYNGCIMLYIIYMAYEYNVNGSVFYNSFSISLW